VLSPELLTSGVLLSGVLSSVALSSGVMSSRVLSSGVVIWCCHLKLSSEVTWSTFYLFIENFIQSPTNSFYLAMYLKLKSHSCVKAIEHNRLTVKLTMVEAIRYEQNR
jgi:hypothetical protein